MSPFADTDLRGAYTNIASPSEFGSHSRSISSVGPPNGFPPQACDRNRNLIVWERCKKQMVIGRRHIHWITS